MPAQWTGSIVGEMHLHGIKVTDLATEANLNPKYLSTVLNSEDTPKGAKDKITAALHRLIERKRNEGV